MSSSGLMGAVTFTEFAILGKQICDIPLNRGHVCVEHWEGTEAACGECPPVLWGCTNEWGHELNRLVPWATLGGNKFSTMDLSLAKYGILLLPLAHAPC